MSETDVPSIKTLEAIQPANSATGEPVLTYDNLSAAVAKYRLTNARRSDLVWEAELGSLTEQGKARQLAFEYLLRNSEQVVESNETNRDLWAERFTQASIEIYGEPDKTETTRLITDEYEQLLGLRGQEDISQEPLELLLKTYQPIVEASGKRNGHVETRDDEEELERAIDEYGEAITEKYQQLLSLVDDSGKELFTPSDLKKLFVDALNWLKTNDDESWANWSVETIDGTAMRVNAQERKIKVTSRRELVSRDDAKKLLVHELLVHALRSNNGYKTGDKKLANGLPGYQKTEEGLAILSEEAVTGVFPEKAMNKYVDIALALGIVDGVQRTRQQLFEISYARQIVRAESRGKDPNLELLKSRTWDYVDRIYRGGLGDDKGKKQAIFTKDIEYYAGYKTMSKYITEELARGKTAVEVFNYLSQAKFDPTNPQHLDRLNNPQVEA